MYVHRQLLHRDFPAELLAVLGGEAAEREGPLVQRAAEEDVAVDGVEAREFARRIAGVENGVDLAGIGIPEIGTSSSMATSLK